MLWIGLFGGVVAWGFQLLVGYAITEVACPDRPLVDAAGAGSELTVVLTGVSVVAALGAVVAAVVALSAWRATDRPHRDREIGFVGLLLDGLFIGVILLTATGPLFVPGCS